MSALMLANLATAALLPPLVRGRAAAPPSRCAALSHVRAPPPRLQLMDVPGDDEDEDDEENTREEVDEGDVEEVDAFRAQLLRQFGGGGGSTEAADEAEEAELDEPREPQEWGGVDDERARLMRQFGGGGAGDEEAAPEDSEPQQPTARESGVPAVGAVLVANPQRFCNRNPFSRAVKDLNRFGLQGPVAGDDISPDTKAQMLPVLLLIEHGDQGSAAILLERRTGALMGDISMDEYGCVAISPLWLGGTEKQNSLYCVHNCPEVGGSSVLGENLFVGGWEAARPKVADSSLAEGRFKFFLGCTQWGRDQLKEEIEAGAWLVLECDSELVMKDRVSGWQPGKPKPVWTELVRALGADYEAVLGQIYPED